MTVSIRLPKETRPRIAPLSTLPVFLSVSGRPVTVIGGGAPAAWKAELLAAAGARVTVLATSVSTEMRAVIQACDGAINHVQRDWQEADLSNYALIVADAVDEQEGAAIQARARSLRVPCNIIDMPALCDFSFGSIVNRAPVTIAISTDGAAPVLGQAIRRRIEAVLPRGLERWGRAASNIRRRVAEALPDASARRRFWTRFSDMAMGMSRDLNTEELSNELLTATASGCDGAGGIAIVGAGPGSDDYLTLGAIRALQTADVVLYDSLVTSEVLELARREARRIDVGKRGGRPSCRQDDINALAIKLALAGNQVVRLKAGDPGVFGRAGEEVDAFRSAGIHVEIVPGVTAALAMAARLGVSLTDRRVAQSVRFVTAHTASGSLPDRIDWQSIAAGGETTLFYMGWKAAERLADRLSASGMSPDTPVAIGASIGRPEEQIIRTTLGALTTLSRTVPLVAPILIGVGVVFAGEEEPSAASTLVPFGALAEAGA